MVYTSYFGNTKRLSALPHTTLISIAGKAPAWWGGEEMKELAPSYDIWKEYQEKHDIELYTKRFYEERLALLNPRETLLEIIARSGNYKGFNYLPDSVLLCYETPEKFCHRQLVADWLGKENRLKIYEYGKGMF